jgi:hypothetical protein
MISVLSRKHLQCGGMTKDLCAGSDIRSEEATVVDNNGTATFPAMPNACRGMNAETTTVTTTADSSSLLATVTATSTNALMTSTTTQSSATSSAESPVANAAGRPPPKALASVWLCVLLLLAVFLGPAEASADYLDIHNRRALLLSHPNLTSQLLAIKRSDAPKWCHGDAHCGVMEEIYGFVVEYFKGKGKDAINGEDWVPDDFVGNIMQQACKTLPDTGFKQIGGKVGLDEVGTAMKTVCKPFVLDCVATIDSFGAAIPALLSSTVLCDALLAQSTKQPGPFFGHMSSVLGSTS